MNPWLEPLTLMLKIVLLAMEGQTPDQRAKLWGMYITDVERWRTFWDKALNLKALDTPPS